MPERTATAAHDSELAQELRRGGQRVTSQRLVINRALKALDRHVTAEEVLSAVTERLPGVSLPTIYSTLELFERLGIVRRVSARGGAVLYDPRREEHSHLICERCGKVEDLDLTPETEGVLAAARRQGFEPARAELVLHGLCAACAAGTAPRRP
ncbi:MAG: transcriptional repressor [Thermoleophilaceae bacterium]|nr:transcriptional repressor [Thermoleophilaceae bacterium]